MCLICVEFFRGKSMVTRKNSNYFGTNSTRMFSKINNSSSLDSEILEFLSHCPSFIEFRVFFAHTSMY